MSSLLLLLAFGLSIDWSAILTQDNILAILFGIALIVLPQYKEQIEKLKALFGKGESPAMKIARLSEEKEIMESKINSLYQRMDREDVAVARDPVKDKREAANAACNYLTGYFLEDLDKDGVEAMKAVWSRINKMPTPLEPPVG